MSEMSGCDAGDDALAAEYTVVGGPGDQFVQYTAVDADVNGMAERVLVDRTGDRVADLELFDGDQDGVYESALVDHQGDRVYDAQLLDTDENGFFDQQVGGAPVVAQPQPAPAPAPASGPSLIEMYEQVLNTPIDTSDPEAVARRDETLDELAELIERRQAHTAKIIDSM